MAVPKRRTPRAKTRSRRSANWRLDAPARSVCPNCGSTKLPHVVCGVCGWYRGRKAIEVD
jgi:large subunit ribosomal protein L32